MALALVTLAPLLFALGAALWTAPYPISETVSLLENAGVMHAEASVPGIDPTLRRLFDPRLRSWYRPFYHSTWYILWHITHSLPQTLLIFKVLEVAAAVGAVLLLIWIARPARLIECAAAIFAAAVLVGTPGFRDNLEIPLLMTLVAMPMMLVTWMLLERDYRAWHGAVIALLTLVAIGYKEQGLIVFPFVVAAWWAGAPGVKRRDVIGLAVVVIAYLVFRFTVKGTWGAFEQDVGFGFHVIPAAEASRRFGAFPFWLYAYNGASTIATILFSEPSGGVFRVSRDVLAGRVDPWEINNLVSSTVLTLAMAWWAVGVWRRDRRLPWTRELRLIIATVAILAASGALGFNYSRDRLGGMAVPFYVLCAYFTARALVDAAAAGRRAVLVIVVLAVVAVGWQLRAVGTVESVHLTSIKVHRDWLTDLRARHLDFAGSPDYVRILDAMTQQGAERRPQLMFSRATDRWLIEP